MALQNATPRSLIVVFTDNGSKDLDLEKEIVRQVDIPRKVLGRAGLATIFSVTTSDSTTLRGFCDTLKYEK